MGEIINLKRARKQRARAEDETAKAANRVRFGRTRAERLNDAATDATATRRLDGARLERGTPPSADTDSPDE
jgi:hypothetical protein